MTKEGDKITSVVVKHIENGKELKFEAPLFSDCTGDGTIGYLAGADYRRGREGRDEYGESIAPEKADKLTMVLPSSGILWITRNRVLSRSSAMEWSLTTRIVKR